MYMLEIFPFDKMIFQSSKQEYMYLNKKQFQVFGNWLVIQRYMVLNTFTVPIILHKTISTNKVESKKCKRSKIWNKKLSTKVEELTQEKGSKIVVYRCSVVINLFNSQYISCCLTDNTWIVWIILHLPQ